MRRLHFCLVLWLGMSAPCWGWNEQAAQVTPASAKAIRTHSTKHYITPVQNATVLIVPGLLVMGCNSLFVLSDQDPWTYSTLMAAVTKNVPFSVAYDVDQKAPWDAGSCAITSITYNG